LPQLEIEDNDKRTPHDSTYTNIKMALIVWGSIITVGERHFAPTRHDRQRPRPNYRPDDWSQQV
jgi:hypothetical protein